MSSAEQLSQIVHHRDLVEIQLFFFRQRKKKIKNPIMYIYNKNSLNDFKDTLDVI